MQAVLSLLQPGRFPPPVYPPYWPPDARPHPRPVRNHLATASPMIVLFPTYARRIAGGNRWRATVAGMVVRPLPATSRRRVLAMAVFRRLFDLDEEQLRQEVFRRRSDAFLFRRKLAR